MKQRLTGAVILVALFVLLVPELLTGPRASKPAEPTDETGLRRYTIDIDAPQSSVQPAMPATPAEVSLPEVAQNPFRDAARAAPGEAAAPAPAPAQPQDVTPPAPIEGAPPARSSAPTSPSPAAAPRPDAPTVDARKNDSPRATPATTPAASPPRAADAPGTGAFAVQLGTFKERDNADRLVRDMTAKGFAAFVAPFKTGGRELYRVRVGPTRDRAAAEALAVQLKRAGQSGSVVSIS